MPKDMSFLPREEVLDLEEMEEICAAFVRSGVRKIRLTGGEPLVRRGVMTLVKGLSRYLDGGELDELTLTTNGTLLAKNADALHRHGIRRINVSLDTLDPESYASLTRAGKLSNVMDGLSAARDSGLKVKINCLALKGVNDHELSALVDWCGANGFDLTFIEAMPMGDIGPCRVMSYMSAAEVKEALSRDWTLDETSHSTGGPSKYFSVKETGCKVGFISPLSGNFCEGCNRVRLTCTGQLYLCLGQGDRVDLRTVLREGGSVEDAIREGITAKPRGHDFEYDRQQGSEAGTTDRFMSVTGG
jgi:cyclic pyranopterin phosphate synthase